LLNDLNHLFQPTLSNGTSQNRNWHFEQNLVVNMIQTTNAFGQVTELIPIDGRKFVLVLAPSEREVQIVLSDRRLNEEKFCEINVKLRNVFHAILMGCIEKYWDYFVNCVIMTFVILMDVLKISVTLWKKSYERWVLYYSIGR